MPVPKGGKMNPKARRFRVAKDRLMRFAREYVVDLDPIAAYQRAGWKCSERSASQRACHLLARPEVQAEVARLKAAQAERLDLKADDVLRELLRIARVDIGEAFDQAGNLKPIHEIPVDVRRAMSGIDVEEANYGDDGEDGSGIVTRVKKVRFWDKRGALELLGKHLKLFVDRVEVKDVTDRAAALARARARALNLPSPPASGPTGQGASAAAASP